MACECAPRGRAVLAGVRLRSRAALHRGVSSRGRGISSAWGAAASGNPWAGAQRTRRLPRRFAGVGGSRRGSPASEAAASGSPDLLAHIVRANLPHASRSVSALSSEFAELSSRSAAESGAMSSQIAGTARVGLAEPACEEGSAAHRCCCRSAGNAHHITARVTSLMDSLFSAGIRATTAARALH